MKNIYFLLLLTLLLVPDNYSQTPQWRTLPNSPSDPARHEDVFFINANTGWVANIFGKIFKTTDGGATWITQFNTPNVYFRSIGFTDSLRGWAGLLPNLAVQDTVILYKTVNGGSNWTPVPKQDIPNPKPTGVCGIWIINSSIIYAGGRWDGPARFIKTTNGGFSWNTMDLSPLADCISDFYFPSVDTGFAVGGIGSTQNNRKAVILFTSNGGNNWITRFTNSDTSQWCWKISFPTQSIGYVSIENISNQGPVYF